jgi:hypothetical protein
MKKFTIYRLILAKALYNLGPKTIAADDMTNKEAMVATSQIIAAANAFLATLDDNQRGPCFTNLTMRNSAPAGRIFQRVLSRVVG